MQQLISADLHKHKIMLASLQECRWEGEAVAKKMDGYVWFGGVAWRNKSGAKVGGVVVGRERSRNMNIETVE